MRLRFASAHTPAPHTSPCRPKRPSGEAFGAGLVGPSGQLAPNWTPSALSSLPR